MVIAILNLIPTELIMAGDKRFNGSIEKTKAYRGVHFLLVAVNLLGSATLAFSAAVGSTKDFEKLFDSLSISTLKLQVTNEDLQSLRQDPRGYVSCALIEGETIYTNVAVHLKGSAGSFMPIDKKASFTLNMDKFAKGQQFHEMDKWHLNNSIQDPSYLNELFCSELFLKAGVPCPRVTLALVKLNSENLGIYILKEGFDRTFLKRHFKNPDGNLYDAERGQDITSHLEKDSGNESDDWSDLKGFVKIMQQPDLKTRWAKVQDALNVELFIRFLAMEAITWHWDGYAMHQNNYRLYCDPDSGFVFMPHGMDQMFWEADGSILPPMQGSVALRLLEISQAKILYQNRISELSEKIMDSESLIARFNEIQTRIQAILIPHDPTLASEQAKHAKVVLSRLIERANFLRTSLLENNTD